VADSDDPITFKTPCFLNMATSLGSNTAPHAWAPKAYYDPDRRKYAIVWFGNADRGRTYVSYTKDFVSLTNPTPDMLFDPGYGEIDATVVPHNGHNYLFYKDEWKPISPDGLLVWVYWAPSLWCPRRRRPFL